MSSFKFPFKNLNQPLGVTPFLDESDYLSVRSSVEELQMLSGDNRDLTGLSVQELLQVQLELESLI